MKLPDQQDNLSSSTQHQQTARSHDNDSKKDETQAVEDVSQRRDSVGSTLESFPFVANGNEEAIYLIQNGGSSVPVKTSDVPEFPFSVTKVWLYATLIIAIYVIGMMTLGPLTAQYLVHYFTQGHHNLTANSSRSKSTCANSTGMEDDFMNAAQKQASSTMLYSTIASNIPAFFTCIFAGSISDFVGRKAVLIVSLSGMIFKVALLCLIIKFQLSIEFVYVGSVVDGAVGSYFVTVLAVTAVITDITNDTKSKAVQFVIMEGVILVFGALSQVSLCIRE